MECLTRFFQPFLIPSRTHVGCIDDLLKQTLFERSWVNTKEKEALAPESGGTVLAIGDTAVGINEGQGGIAAILASKEGVTAGEPKRMFALGKGHGAQANAELVLHELWPYILPEIVILFFSEETDIDDNLTQNPLLATSLYSTKCRQLQPEDLMSESLAPFDRALLVLPRMFEAKSLLRSIYFEMEAIRQRHWHHITEANKEPALADRRRLFLQNFGANSETDWQVTEIVFKRIIKFVQDRGAKPLIVRLPAMISVQDDAWERSQRELCGDTVVENTKHCGPIDRDLPARRLNKLAESQKVRLVDPTHILRRAYISSEQIYDFNGQLLELGEARIANLLATVLTPRAGEHSVGSPNGPRVFFAGHPDLELIGFWPIEFDSQHPFAWSQGLSELRISGLLKNKSYSATLELWDTTAAKSISVMVNKPWEELVITERIVKIPFPLVANAEGCIILKIKTPTWKPVDLAPQSKDSRTLGVAFSKLRMELITPEKAPNGQKSNNP